MKKKTIEKIPYLTLPEVSRKKDVKYIGVTAFKDVAHERHLLVEVYRNSKACRETPVVRIAMNKKDFGTFFPATGEWSRGQIVADTRGSYGLIWRGDDGQARKTIDEMAKENTLYSQEDLGRIRAFTGARAWQESEWWEYIDEMQEGITTTESREKSRRKNGRRKQALAERGRDTPELPEHRVLEYADRVLFHSLHYLYYKKHGARVEVACSKCGGVSDVRWKQGISYESQFMRMGQEPRQGANGTCPMCGAMGRYVPQGRVKGLSRQSAHLFLGQRYRGEGMVFRYIEVGKEWELQEICGEKGAEMYSSREKLDGIEIARAYFEPGKKVQVDFHKHNPWAGNDYWDDCNLSGLSNITIREALVMPETFGNMVGTSLQYCAMEEFQRAAGTINPVDYIKRYTQMPQIEMLVKMGMTGIVRHLVKYGAEIVADRDAGRPEAFLGIHKERVKQLAKCKGDVGMLGVMQIEKQAGQRWTDVQLGQLAEADPDRAQAMAAIGHMGIQKLLNHISKYAGCGYGTMCGTASHRLKATAQTYLDYLGMREALGYDMGNTVYLFPRDLWAAHAKMVQERDEQENDRHIMEVEAKYPLIRENYRRFRNIFYYIDENFLIRPARSAEEIVTEGRVLHHCVGGDGYLGKHNNGTSIILFLRDVKEPEMPYITVEIAMDTLGIRQWYGAGNNKPDERNVDKWLGAYVARLKCTRDGVAMEGADGEATPLLAYA